MTNFVKSLVVLCCLGSVADAARVKGCKIPSGAPQLRVSRLALELVRPESPVVPPSPKRTGRSAADFCEKTPTRIIERKGRTRCASNKLEPKSLYLPGSKQEEHLDVADYCFSCDARDGGLASSAQLRSLFQSQAALALITHVVIQCCSPEFANDQFVASLFTGLLPCLRDVTFVNSLMPGGTEPWWVESLRGRCKVNFVVEPLQEVLPADFD